VSDIKATVEELDRNSRISTAKFLLVALREWPSLLAELRRCWAIEEAAVSLREASEAYQELKMSADMAAVNYANRRNAVAREDLFAALPPRPSEGEEGKP